jgi:hypothetical protein
MEMRTVQQLDLPECFEVRGTEKTQSCNPDNIATAKLIKSDTRSCPNCNEGIYKIEGCAQMWCTSCKTPFDWNTGKIIAEIYTTHITSRRDNQLRETHTTSSAEENSPPDS